MKIKKLRKVSNAPILISEQYDQKALLFSVRNSNKDYIHMRNYKVIGEELNVKCRDFCKLYKPETFITFDPKLVNVINMKKKYQIIKKLQNIKPGHLIGIFRLDKYHYLLMSETNAEVVIYNIKTYEIVQTIRKYEVDKTSKPIQQYLCCFGIMQGLKTISIQQLDWMKNAGIGQ
ncbi:UNKNOWN [Stylonychia lemnae]|uniref:Uncharacterized protein n=1 Tax=Stylonychia lemnae TaxID=5949 RepID=A0A078ANZ3_STYLE|nr:UNKNOWN [Stylonychia lemnae]|eukprot:CDW83646.1 UNKNOWN [Stylonychia lemnae]